MISVKFNPGGTKIVVGIELFMIAIVDASNGAVLSAYDTDGDVGKKRLLMDSSDNIYAIMTIWRLVKLGAGTGNSIWLT